MKRRHTYDNNPNLKLLKAVPGFYGAGRMRIVLTARLFCAVMVVLLFLAAHAAAQAQPPSGAAVQNPQGDAAPAVLRITTREVLVDVVATDDRNHPVRDLSASEIEIVEVKDGGRKDSVAMASFHPADAALEDAQPAPQSGGFRVSLGGDCAARATFHYEISFHPDEDGWQSGYHNIEVRTTRKAVKLSYHNRYYVGAKEALPGLPSRKDLDAALQNAACYHPDVPASIGLSVQPVATGIKDTLRYFVTVDADSLKFISVSFGNQRVQLDYGACAFNAQGRPTRYFSSAADRMLTSSEFAQATVHGFPNLLEFPRMKDVVLMRIAVRDRTTGNIGTTTIPLTQAAPLREAEVDRTHDEHTVEKIAMGQLDYARMRANSVASYLAPLSGPIGSFGSILPKQNSFCGDVYELPKGTGQLPNFWNLSSVGSLYTSSLDVPEQIFSNTGGVAGVTSHAEWFGIDYHAVFWVKNAGEYEFHAVVDDGVRLYIDDQKVIDLDGLHSGADRGGRVTLSAGLHTIHVPYFQGEPYSVGLVLAVRPPGEKNFRIFDLREFAAPGETAKSPGAAQ